MSIDPDALKEFAATWHEGRERSQAEVRPVSPELPRVYRRQAWIAAVVALVGIAAFVIAIVAAARTGQQRAGEDRPLSPLAYLGAIGALVAVVAGGCAVHQRIVARVLNGASWQTSPHTEVTVGRGKYAIPVVHLSTTNRTYRPSFKLFAPSLAKHASVEWAGDPDGHIVVRRPRGSWVALYRVRSGSR